MFTPGRSLFALIFALVFLVALIVAYRRDVAYIKKSYPRVWVVVLSILLFLVAFVWVKRLVIGR